MVIKQLFGSKSSEKKDPSNSNLEGKEHINSEEFAQIVDGITFPIWYRNKDLSLKYCNKAFSDILESSKDDVIANNMELYQGSSELAKKAIETHSIRNIKKHVVVFSQRRFFQITEVPTDSGTIGFASDITELEDSERELQQHMSVQSDLLESSASGIAIYGSDNKLKFYNNAFMNLWKLDERFLSSNPTYAEILESLREKRKLPEQADFKSFKKDNVAMFTNLIEKHEEFYYLPDGRVFHVIVIPHEHGGLLFSYEDMTEQITLERSYNTLMSVKKSTIDNLYEAVVVFGEDGKMQLSNPVYQDMWQLDSAIINSEPHISEVLEETKFLYQHGDDWEAYKQNIILQSTKREVFEQKLELVDGSVLKWLCVPLPDGATLMTYIDITDSSRIEQSLRTEKQALEEADKIKTNFLANVSYEFRSPLTSIKGFSEVLLQDYFGKLNEKQKEYVEGIHESSQKLNRLIDNILDVASIDAGYMTLEISEFDIGEVLQEVVDETKKEYKDKKFSLELNIKPKIGKMTGDKKRIKQTVSNIISNSIRFISEGGKINLSVESKNRDKDIIIVIEDNGEGIDEEKQPFVFDKFYKTDTDDYAGIGLGLPIAKNFIELHGGSIELESEVGVGTKITCKLKRKNESK